MAPASEPLPTAFTDDNTLTFDLKGKSANLAPTDSNYVRGLVTWNYWQKLDSVIKNHRSAKEILKDAKTSDQIIAAVREVAGEADKMGSEISSLPVTNVDPEATAYASLLVQMFGKFETAYTDLADLFVEIKEFKEYKGSDRGLCTFIQKRLHNLRLLFIQTDYFCKARHFDSVTGRRARPSAEWCSTVIA